MGASGSGKTTLMNILGCLDRPSSGEFWLDGEEMSGLTPNQRALVRTAKLGFVFQSFNLLGRTTAVNNVVMPLDYSPTRPSQHEGHKRALELLDRVGLGLRLDHEPSQMSGGQQQRVAIARSLINQPAVLLADEPTGNLDSRTSVEILQMFQQLNTVGITVILVTHDPKVAGYAHRTIRLADGLIESDGPSAPLPVGLPSEPESESNGHSISNGHNGTSHFDSAHSNGNGHNGNGIETNGSQSPEELAWEPELPGGGTAVARRVGQRELVSTVVKVTTQPEAAINPRACRRPPTIRSTFPLRISNLCWRACCRRRSRTALGALRRNVMRSALTTLGIIIGVGAVIAMVEIGQGSKSAIQQTIASMGANSLQVNSGAASSGGVSFGSGSVLTLTPQDASEIARQCPSVEAVAPMVRARASSHLRQPQLGAHEYLWHYARIFCRPRLGKFGRR